MTVSEFCGKVHLPSVVAHFGCEPPKLYRKVPTHGWYAQSKGQDQTYNCIDLFRLCCTDSPKEDECSFMMECYRYYTRDHPELLEVPISYSETTETRLLNDYLIWRAQRRLHQTCRLEALEGDIVYRAKKWKFTKLLEEMGMPHFMHSGVGLYKPHIVNQKEFDILKLRGKYDRYSLLIPTFFAPNGCIASLDVAVLGDLSQKRIIYRKGEFGWYGQLHRNIVGNLHDLMTIEGCTWHPWLCSWLNGQSVTLHHSLMPNQCIEIWSNLENIRTDKNPLSLINRKDFSQTIKENLAKLNVNQLAELEKLTGENLRRDWLVARTTETSVGGIRFLNNKGRYYYIRNNSPIEFANFAVDLTRINKEDNEFYQHGYITMNEQTTAFKLKRRYFVSYQQLIAELTNVLLEAGMGVPVIAPNLKHYLINVIEAFNPVNIIEKPKPVEPTDLPNEGRILHTS